MKVTQVRSGKAQEVDLAEAVSESLKHTYGDGELEKMREQMNAQADALGKLYAYVVKGDHSQDAKSALVGEVLCYQYTLQD